MAALAANPDEISLRPLSLRPGSSASNPFAAFGKGAGYGVRSKAAVAASASVPEAPKKPKSQIIRYTKEFLLKFMDRYHQCPLDLQQSQLEIVFSGEEERDQQRQTLQRVAEEVVDERDWRTRAPALAEPASRQAGPERGQQAAAQPAQAAAQAPAPRAAEPSRPAAAAVSQPSAAQAAATSRIQKASDLGREAYKVGAALSNEARVARTIKGILNKLTPEKFERLLDQLLQVITTASVLKETISMVFENAVAQPTFCAMYADLCLRLSRELPSFPPQGGDDKPMTFKRVLLNTCQDEFEGAAEAREELAAATNVEDRPTAERAVKMRTLGTVRLIAELYVKEVVKESIVLVVIRELLDARGGSKVPPEDNIEAACEMITICGKTLAGSEAKKARDQLDSYMANLQKLGDARELSSRVRFVIKDVLEMRRNKWVPRRETFTAKKLDEVHAEAEAELGMVSSRLADAAALPALPTQSRMAPEEVILLPPLRGGDDWDFLGPRSGAGSRPAGTGGSALIGDYKPPPPLEKRAAPAPAAPAAAAPAASKPAPAASKPAGPLSEEDVESKAKSTFQEFLSVGDAQEVAVCIQELNAPQHHGVVVATGLEQAMDALKEKDQVQLVTLLLGLSQQGLLSGAHLMAGLQKHTADLEGLSMDAPKAPALLGSFFGQAAAAGVLDLAELASLLEPCELGDARRKFAGAALKALQQAKGDSGLAAACKAAGFKASPLLDKQEFDEEGLPDTPAWLKAEGLTAVPV